MMTTKYRIVFLDIFIYLYIEIFLESIRQCEALRSSNNWCSSLAKVEAGVPQGSILGPLLFLIYVNDLSESVAASLKLFPDGTSLFSVVKNIDASDIDLN